jgi:hypothetical protein
MDQAAPGRSPAPPRTGPSVGLRRAVAALLLAGAACTQTYYKDFAVEPRDRSYAAEAQFADIKAWVLSRGLRILTESTGFLDVELEPGESLRIRLVPGKVELTLVRSSPRGDFPAGEIRKFQQALESRLRERTGQPVTIRLVDERTRPLTNIK